MTIKELVGYYKENVARTCEALGLTKAAVHRWVTHNMDVPIDIQIRAHVLSKGRLKADPWYDENAKGERKFKKELMKKRPFSKKLNQSADVCNKEELQ